MEKYAMFDIPGNIYNWLVAYFSGHSHCTTYHGQMSDPLQISASIIQGSAIGPASWRHCFWSGCSVSRQYFLLIRRWYLHHYPSAECWHQNLRTAQCRSLVKRE